MLFASQCLARALFCNKWLPFSVVFVKCWMPHIFSVPQLLIYFHSIINVTEFLKPGNWHQIRKWLVTFIWYLRVHKMPIYILLSAVDTIKCKSVYLSSIHEREYTYGRQYLASRFENDLIVFPGWPQMSGLKWSCCFSYLNSEHIYIYYHTQLVNYTILPIVGQKNTMKIL